MITESIMLPVLLMTMSGTPKINQKFESDACYVEDVTAFTSTFSKTDHIWIQSTQMNISRNEAFEIFGPMRALNKEEQAIYNRVVKKMSQKTGKVIFKLK